jgi:hypothetical protein
MERALRHLSVRAFRRSGIRRVGGRNHGRRAGARGAEPLTLVAARSSRIGRRDRGAWRAGGRSGEHAVAARTEPQRLAVTGPDRLMSGRRRKRGSPPLTSPAKRIGVGLSSVARLALGLGIHWPDQRYRHESRECSQLAGIGMSPSLSAPPVRFWRPHSTPSRIPSHPAIGLLGSSLHVTTCINRQKHLRCSAEADHREQGHTAQIGQGFERRPSSRPATVGLSYCARAPGAAARSTGRSSGSSTVVRF